ncbi:MAG: type II toxin-antitoxin system Phd/YefM family antitoxin [Candidatus Thiodiazotropha lotti]|nr:type II toxin-antitoxin system Phd/YefM family antitoxin [Candidatus Thiodiazotropha lotti]
MTKMSANAAKARFGELLDTARREPVTIEKHGRPVAVILSTEEYEELEALKLFRLRSELGIGLDALSNGDFIDIDEANVESLASEVKATGRRSSKSG